MRSTIENAVLLGITNKSLFKEMLSHFTSNIQAQCEHAQSDAENRLVMRSQIKAFLEPLGINPYRVNFGNLITQFSETAELFGETDIGLTTDFNNLIEQVRWAWVQVSEKTKIDTLSTPKDIEENKDENIKNLPALIEVVLNDRKIFERMLNHIDNDLIPRWSSRNSKFNKKEFLTELEKFIKPLKINPHASLQLYNDFAKLLQHKLPGTKGGLELLNDFSLFMSTFSNLWNQVVTQIDLSPLPTSTPKVTKPSVTHPSPPKPIVIKDESALVDWMVIERLLAQDGKFTERTDRLHDISMEIFAPMDNLDSKYAWLIHRNDPNAADALKGVDVKYYVGRVIDYCLELGIKDPSFLLSDGMLRNLFQSFDRQLDILKEKGRDDITANVNRTACAAFFSAVGRYSYVMKVLVKHFPKHASIPKSWLNTEFSASQQSKANPSASPKEEKKETETRSQPQPKTAPSTSHDANDDLYLEFTLDASQEEEKIKKSIKLLNTKIQSIPKQKDKKSEEKLTSGYNSAKERNQFKLQVMLQATINLLHRLEKLLKIYNPSDDEAVNKQVRKVLATCEPIVFHEYTGSKDEKRNTRMPQQNPSPPVAEQKTVKKIKPETLRKKLADVLERWNPPFFLKLMADEAYRISIPDMKPSDINWVVGQLVEKYTNLKAQYEADEERSEIVACLRAFISSSKKSFDTLTLLGDYQSQMRTGTTITKIVAGNEETRTASDLFKIRSGMEKIDLFWDPLKQLFLFEKSLDEIIDLKKFKGMDFLSHYVVYLTDDDKLYFSNVLAPEALDYSSIFHKYLSSPDTMNHHASQLYDSKSLLALQLFGAFKILANEFGITIHELVQLIPTRLIGNRLSFIPYDNVSLEIYPKHLIFSWSTHTPPASHEWINFSTQYALQGIFFGQRAMITARDDLQNYIVIPIETFINEFLISQIAPLVQAKEQILAKLEQLRSKTNFSRPINRIIAEYYSLPQSLNIIFSDDPYQYYIKKGFERLDVTESEAASFYNNAMLHALILGSDPSKFATTISDLLTEMHAEATPKLVNQNLVAAYCLIKYAVVLKHTVLEHSSRLPDLMPTAMALDRIVTKLNLQPYIKELEDLSVQLWLKMIHRPIHLFLKEFFKSNGLKSFCDEHYRSGDFKLMQPVLKPIVFEKAPDERAVILLKQIDKELQKLAKKGRFPESEFTLKRIASFISQFLGLQPTKEFMYTLRKLAHAYQGCAKFATTVSRSRLALLSPSQTAKTDIPVKTDTDDPNQQQSPQVVCEDEYIAKAPTHGNDETIRETFFEL